MLGYYLLLRKKEEGGLPRNGIIIKTIVTTELQREVAQGFDIKIDDVLTGFKWIADKMKYYENSKRAAFIFGGEESYGYLPVSFVRDKDAVSSCYFFAEMADWVKKRKQSLYEFLDEIYINYNLYSEELKSYTLKGTDGVIPTQAFVPHSSWFSRAMILSIMSSLSGRIVNGISCLGPNSCRNASRRWCP